MGIEHEWCEALTALVFLEIMETKRIFEEDGLGGLGGGGTGTGPVAEDVSRRL